MVRIERIILTFLSDATSLSNRALYTFQVFGSSTESESTFEISSGVIYSKLSGLVKKSSGDKKPAGSQPISTSAEYVTRHVCLKSSLA